MTRRLFPTQEIGSLAKPRWQILGQRSEPLDAAAKQELEEWDRRTGFAQDAPDVRDALLAGRARDASPEQVRDLGALFGLRFLETAGLDRVYDGEARRIEMYEYPIRQMHGFRFGGHVRSFDNKYYLKATVTDEVRLDHPYHIDEFDFVKRHAHAEPKLPITGPYTLADWS